MSVSKSSRCLFVQLAKLPQLITSSKDSSATEGHNGIIAGLFNAGVSPMFAVGNPRDKAYVPCPLFLAAVSGHYHTVALFTDRDDCPDACRHVFTVVLPK